MKKYFLSFLLIFCCLLSDAKTKDKPFLVSHYIYGQGEPILIINGGPGMNAAGFETIAQLIANLGCRTIRFDQRGTGKSTINNPNTENITMDLMVEDMEVLRKHLKIKSWILFGHSFGGILATHYAAKYPAKIKKIIFSSSGGVDLDFMGKINNQLQKNLSKTDLDSLNFYNNAFSNNSKDLKIKGKRLFYFANMYVYQKRHIPLIAARLDQVNMQINALVFQDLQKIKYDYTNFFKNFN